MKWGFQQKTSKLAIIAPWFSVLLPPVGILVSIAALWSARKNSLRGETRALVGIAMGVVFSFPFFVIVRPVILGNTAQKSFGPIAKQVEKLGGTKLCSNGDGGYGIDNTTPWYEVYYRVPNGSDLTNKIKQIAANEGFQLQEDTAFINQLTGSDFTPYGNAKYNPKSDYLIGQNDGKSLRVTINREASVPLYCGVSNYGKEALTGNDSIIDFNLSR